HTIEGIEAGASKASELLANRMAEALALRVRPVSIDQPRFTAGSVAFRRNRLMLRTRFAMRFSTDEHDDPETTAHRDIIRTAFNSPFWPFVLATTSIGQEGLDFHGFCHAVVHWNLPSNPVDLEQREGRVHRYKGHAVRKNVARAHRHRVNGDSRDPWEIMFAAAKAEQEGKTSDLVPFWVYTVEGGAQIERH